MMVYGRMMGGVPSGAFTARAFVRRCAGRHMFRRGMADQVDGAEGSRASTDDAGKAATQAVHSAKASDGDSDKAAAEMGDGAKAGGAAGVVKKARVKKSESEKAAEKARADRAHLKKIFAGYKGKDDDPGMRASSEKLLRFADEALKKRKDIQASIQQRSAQAKETKEKDLKVAELRVLNIVPAHTKVEIKLMHKTDPEYWKSWRLASHFKVSLSQIKGILLLEKIKDDLDRLGKVNPTARMRAARAQDLWDSLPAPAPELVPLSSGEHGARFTTPNFELFDEEIDETMMDAMQRRGIKGSILESVKDSLETREAENAGTSKKEPDATAAKEEGHEEGVHDNRSSEWIAQAEGEEDVYWKRLESGNHYLRAQREAFERSRVGRGVDHKLRTRWIFVDTSKLSDENERRVFVRESNGFLHDSSAREKKRAQGARGVRMKRRTALDIY